MTLDPVQLLVELLDIESVNPSMGGSGERAYADRLGQILDDMGLVVELGLVTGNRPNVIGRLPGRVDAPPLLFETHMDTVALPAGGLSVECREGWVIGRGACDTKGSGAAMLAAMADLIAGSDPYPPIVFAGVVDEEAEMLGARELVGRVPEVAGAIIGEPTSLHPVRAHNGLVRFSIRSEGRSAHTSKAYLGVNAIVAAARVVAALDTEVCTLLEKRHHPLTGPGLLTVAMIQGGIAPNMVPDRCELRLDRRLIPGEDAAAALAEVDVVLDRLRQSGDVVVREEPSLLLPAVEVPAGDPLVATVEAAASAVLGRALVAEGVPYGTDAAYLTGVGGIPSVVLGPGSIDHAHTEDERVSVEELRRATAIYAEIARRWAGRAGTEAG